MKAFFVCRSSNRIERIHTQLGSALCPLRAGLVEKRIHALEPDHS